MKNRKIRKREGIHEKLDHLFRCPHPNQSAKNVWKRLINIGLPMLCSLLVVTALIIPARLLNTHAPFVKKGVLDLAQWNEEKAFTLTGEWEFYWDRQLSDEQIKNGEQSSMLVDAPDKWNNYEIGGAHLPGKGRATYRIHIMGAKAGIQYGVRIQSMSSTYRLYMDNELIAHNGNFGDNGRASSIDYRPQLAVFTSASDNFDLVLQVSNEVYGIGGMWEAIIFGTYSRVSAFDRLLSSVIIFVMAGLIFSCLFFMIFFAAQHGERGALILSILSILILLRLSITGDVLFTVIFPNTPIALLSWIDFLTMPWAQFLLLYFIYCTYGQLIRRWQIISLLVYTAGVTLFILLIPVDIFTSAYMPMNYVLLLVMTAVMVQLTRAAWQGREGAPLLLFAVLLIVLLISNEMFLPDWSIEYYLLTSSGFEYIVFVFSQMTVVAMRYRRAHKLEIAHLKGQIRPHFIHNALTSIISISRSDPERARELLVCFSSYLRGFYDYEQDELVSFSQELELVNAYVALEQARFGEKLCIEYQIDTDDFLLPPLILQPLVENAFVHGLRKKENGGTVTVFAVNLNNGRVRLGVRDDGVGFAVNSAPMRQGVGIENINRRLAWLYHTSLVYLVPEGGGCEVYFDISYKKVLKNESLAYR